MNRRALFLAFAVSAAATLAPAARAQQSDSAAQNPRPAQAVAPAAAPAAAQDAPSPLPKSPTQKKVWTDEDMKSLRKDGETNTSPQANSVPERPSEKSAVPSSGKSAKWYQDQIAKLKEKLPPLDEQIGKLQATLDGKQVDETRHYGAKIDDWRDELARLQKKRDEITARIAALQDEARHNGVPVNTLP
jgi:archaellum component FlaC